MAMDEDKTPGFKGRIIPFPGQPAPSRNAPCVPRTHQPPGTKLVLRRTIRACVNRDRVFWILQYYDNLYYAFLALCHHLTDIVPSTVEPDKMLLSTCLHSAMHAWNSAEALQEPERVCYKEFLRGLLKPVPQLMEWTVYVDKVGQRIAWNATDKALTDWWREQDALPFVTRRPQSLDNGTSVLSRKDFRTIIAVKILQKTDISIIDDGLDAIVS